jgi:hypothetical protein
LWRVRPDGLRLGRAAAHGAGTSLAGGELAPDDGGDALAKFRSNRWPGFCCSSPAWSSARPRLRLCFLRARLKRRAMLTFPTAEARAAALVERCAQGPGADAADVLYYADASTSVQVRLGELEDVSRSEGESIGLRFFTGSRSATVSSSDLSDDALHALVERAAAMAREAPEVRLPPGAGGAG